MTLEELLAVAEIVEKLTNRYRDQEAAHKAALTEIRASFNARTSADEKLIEGRRMEIIRLNGANDRLNDLLRAERLAHRDEVAALQERLRASIARGDFAQMEVAALKSQTPKQHGRWVRATSEKCMHAKAGEVVSVRGYLVRTESGEFLWEGEDCEPCDPPEATHDTEAGKAAAESALKTEPVAEEIKVGDVAKVVGASGRGCSAPGTAARLDYAR